MNLQRTDPLERRVSWGDVYATTRLTEGAVVALEVDLHIDRSILSPPASGVLLAHEEYVELAIVVKVARDDVGDDKVARSADSS